MCDLIVHISPHPAEARGADKVKCEVVDKVVTPRTGSGYVKPGVPVTHTGSSSRSSESIAVIIDCPTFARATRLIG